MVSAFGGNSVQIGGPTGAFIVIVAGIITEFGLTGLAVATFMAGIIPGAYGAVPARHSSQVHPLSGGGGFYGRYCLDHIFYADERLFRPWADRRAERLRLQVGCLFLQFRKIDLYTLSVSAASLLIIILTPKISRRLPGALISIIIITAATTLIAWLRPELQVETIGMRFRGRGYGSPRCLVGSLSIWR